MQCLSGFELYSRWVPLNKLTRLAITVVIWTRVWIYIAIMDETDEKFQRRNY